MKKTLALILAIVMALCVLTGCGGTSAPATNAPADNTGSAGNTPAAPAPDGKTYTLSFTIHDPATSAKTALYQEKADLVAAETNGAVNITIYPSGTLCAAPDVAEGILAGTADMGWLFTPFTTGQFPLTEVVMLPMLFNDLYANSMTIRDLYQETPALQAELSNYKVLNIYSMPINQLYSTTPIHTAQDLQGLNIRTSSNTGTTLIGGWGASVMSYGPGDIYEAMNKNAIDAFTFEYSGVKSFKLYEVVKYTLEMPLFGGTFITAMNLDSWNALPAEYQEVVEKHFGWNLTEEFARLYEQDCVAGKQLCEENGVEIIVPTEAEKATFQIAADEFAAAWVAQNTTADFDAQAYLDRAIELYNQYLPDSGMAK